MQPTGIQPSQLLMEVVASAKDKIGQNIAQSEFSQQLHEQHQLAQHAPFGSPAIFASQAETPTQNPLAASPQTVTVQSSSDGSREAKTEALSTKAATDSVLASTSTRNLTVSKWKLAREMTFPDAAALEKVLAQYRLGPSITSAVRDALDGQGQVTMQRLNQILDRAAAGPNDPVPEGTVPAAEIQSLLAAVLQQKPIPALNLQELAIQNKGTYDFGEFRDLMRRFVERAAKATVKQAKAAKAALPQTSESDTGTVKLAADTVSPSRAQLPNQTQSLIANLIPSFLREGKGVFDKLDGRMQVMASSASAASTAIGSEAPAGDEMVSGELPTNSLPSAPLGNGAGDPPGLAETRNAPAWLSEVAQWLQASPESVAKTVPRTPPEISPDLIINGESVAAERLQPIFAFSEGLTRQIDTASGAAVTDKQSVLLSSASALANASLSGAAVFQPMRPTSPGADFVLEGKAVAQTISAESPIPVVEKIAAPTTASFTSSEQGASGSRDSALKNFASPAQQNPQRFAGIPGRPFSTEERPEAPMSFPAEVIADNTRVNIAAAGTETGEKAAVAEPSAPETPTTLFRGVVELKAVTHTDAVSNDEPLAEPIKAQNPVEIPSVPDRLMKTTTPDLTRHAPSQAPSTSPPVVAELTETPTPCNAVAAELPEASARQNAVEGFQSKDRPSSSATPAVPPSAAATGRPIRTMKAAPTEPKVTNPPLDPSAKIVPSSTENRQAAEAADAIQHVEAAPAAPAEEIPTSAVTGKRVPLTGDVPDPTVRARVLTEAQSKSQASPDAAQSVADGHGQPFSGSNMPFGIASLKTAPAYPFTALSGMEATVSPQVADETAESLIPAGSASGARDSGPIAAAIPSRISSPMISDGTAATRLTTPELVVPEESRAGYQNSVELLAQGAVDSETVTGGNAPVSPDAAERTMRHNPLETGARETTAEVKAEKTVAFSQSSEQPSSQGQEQGQRQDNPSAWFRNDVPVVTLAANPAVDKTSEPFSSFTSSLTAELAARIHELHRENRHELTLELQPEHLGRLRVRIGTEDNQVTTLISTDSEHVKELLSRGSSLLRQELASQGLVLEKLQIDVSSQATANGQAFGRHGQGTRRNGSQRQTATVSKAFVEPVIPRTQFTSGNTLLSVFV